MVSLPNKIYIHSETVGDDNKMITTPSFIDEIELPNYEQLSSSLYPLAYQMVIVLNILYKMTRSRNQAAEEPSDLKKIQSMERVRSRIYMQLVKTDKYLGRKKEETKNKKENDQYEAFHKFYNFICPHLQTGAFYKDDGNFVKLKRAVWEESLKISKILSPEIITRIIEKMNSFIYTICAVAQWLE